MTTNDIRQQIGLDGGDQVKQQLNDLGDAGKAAFQKLQDEPRLPTRWPRLARHSTQSA